VRMAGFEADVKAMPMGLHTVISQGGGTNCQYFRLSLLFLLLISVHYPS